MDKKELLYLIEQDSAFMKAFIDEYRQEGIDSGVAERLMSLFVDMKQSVEALVPESLFGRFGNLLHSLDIEKLRNKQNALEKLHDYEQYHKLVENIITNSIFVSKTFYLLKAIGFTSSNVVLIGANGCGKTTFANSIREHLERTDNGIVIPAQKILIFPTYDSLPTYKSAFSDYENRQKVCLDDKQTFTAAKNDDFPYSLSKQYGEELKILVSALISERLERRNNFCSNAQEGDIIHLDDFRSNIDDVIDIWNRLIEHRVLSCDSLGNLKIEYADKQYPAYKMSDGERVIFYIVGRVMLAKDSSLIIVDEPEIHLHKAILNKLWDILEEKRKDCMFIYLTHDIDFASTRIANKLWLKSYTCSASGVFENWEIEQISDSEIPEAMLMKILGSRKKVLFCISLVATLDTIRQTISMDTGFGDIVIPKPEELDYPVLLADLPSTNILAYSLETVVAEKFQTMIERTTFNSRMKDFYDLYRIGLTQTLDTEMLQEAIRATFANRGTIYSENHILFSDKFASDPDLNQRWDAFLKKIKYEPRVSFAEVMVQIQNWLKPYWENLKGV